MIIGYARVSTSEQSLDGQTDALRAAGCEQIRAEAASGKHGSERPVWDETLRNLRSGDTLVVTELSRLGRSLADLAALADDLERRGVALRILNLGVDTGTPSGRLVYSIIGAVAQMERELLIERTHRGLAAARARGRVGGRPRKLGERQVRAARALRDSGQMTMGEIAAEYGIDRSTLYRALGSE